MVENLLQYHRKKIAVSFSGGKDSVFALFNLMNNHKYEIVMLLSTLDPFDRVLMHGFDRALLEIQAASIGIPLRKVKIQSTKNGDSTYSNQMKQELVELKNKGINYVAYGDIFLEEVRNFRKEKLSIVGMDSIFPLWGLNSTFVAWEFVKHKFKAIITCVNTNLISKAWVGKEYNEEFIEYTLLNNIDPCGENGEFHTFVYSGPLFKKKIKYKLDINNPVIYNEFYTYVIRAE